MRRATLIGILGLRLVVVAYVALRGVDSDGRCILGWRAMQPLVVGDTVRYIMGRGSRDECEPGGAGAVEWTSNSDVVSVSGDGLVTARKPGRFLLIAKRNEGALADGYVVARDWRLVLDVSPEQARVGDTIHAVAKAVDSLGRLMLPVPNSVMARYADGQAP